MSRLIDNTTGSTHAINFGVRADIGQLPRSAFSVSAWVYAISQGVNGGGNVVEVVDYSATPFPGWQLRFTTSSLNNSFGIVLTGDTDNRHSFTWPSYSVWHHVVATYNGGTLTAPANTRLYLDGVEPTYTVTQTGTNVGGPTKTKVFVVGNRTFDYTTPFDGRISDLRFWSNTVLTVDEAKRVMAGDIVRPDSIVAHYPFNEDGIAMYDISGKSTPGYVLVSTITRDVDPPNSFISQSWSDMRLSESRFLPWSPPIVGPFPVFQHV